MSRCPARISLRPWNHAYQLRTGVDAVLQRRGWPRTGTAEWGFLDRSGFLVDAEAEDDPATFLAEEIRELQTRGRRHGGRAGHGPGAASPAPPSTWPRGSRPSSRRRSPPATTTAPDCGNGPGPRPCSSTSSAPDGP